MFWIGTGATIIIFFSIRAFINNQQRWQKRMIPHSSRVYYLALQAANLLLVIAGVLFLMLAIVCHVKGLQINFSSAYEYQIKIT